MTESATDPDEITSRLRLWEHTAATNATSRNRVILYDAALTARDARLEIERLRKALAEFHQNIANAENERIERILFRSRGE